MKQLTDFDLEQMTNGNFTPDDVTVKKQVRHELKLSQLIPEQPKPVPKKIILDLHQKTEEQAWQEINDLIKSGVRNAVIITGASGILKTKFKDWITNGILAQYITSWEMINNGSYQIKISAK
ncbi:MAG TPA: Smr/MutS family protein [Alphaproteobacteria bacterium]|nr:Smr/MutS family protein [Alphaproteobacteria bacterium]